MLLSKMARIYKHLHFDVSVICSTVAIIMHYACGGKILIHPLSFCTSSHLLNFEMLSAFLTQNGHEVSLLAPSVYYQFNKKVDMSKVKVIRFQIPGSYATYNEMPSCDHQLKTIDSSLNVNVLEIMSWVFKSQQDMCISLFDDEKTLSVLNSSKFDVIITDDLEMCANVLSHKISVPLISISIGIGMHYFQPDLQMPFSYIPALGGLIKHTSKMTFFQRVKNVLVGVIIERLFFAKLVYFDLQPTHDILATHNLTSDVLQVMYGTPVRRIFNADFAMEYPAPLLPNNVFIGGFFNCPLNESVGDHQALPHDLATFVDSAGDHGIIVFTLGSNIEHFGTWGNIFARTFAKLPQKIIWRYQELDFSPSELGKNTKLMKWLPQKELLLHEKTHLFITHAGAGAMFEAVYSGVPVVTLPLIADQHSNALKLTHLLEMGIGLDFHTLTSEKLEEAIRIVINNKQYKKNALKASIIFRTSLSRHPARLLHEINAIIVTNGSRYLDTPYFEMPWYQYHLVDVYIFLLAVGLSFLMTVIFIYRKCCRLVFKKSKQE